MYPVDLLFGVFIAYHYMRYAEKDGNGEQRYVRQYNAAEYEKHVGNTESDSAFNLPFCFRQITQNIRYVRHSAPFTER